MTAPRLVPLLILFALLASPLVAPATAQDSLVRTDVYEGVEFRWFVANETTASTMDAEPIANGSRGNDHAFLLGVTPLANGTHANATWSVDVTFEFGPGIEATILSASRANLTNTSSVVIPVPFHVNETAVAAPVAIGFSANLTRFDSDGNATALGTITGSVIFTIVEPAVVLPPPGPIPTEPTNWPLIIGGGAAVVAVGGGAVVLYRRSQRPKVQPRSRVLQEMQLEQRMEKLEKKQETSEEAREEIQEIQEQIRATEQVRVRNRDYMITEAKRDDIVKQIGLLRKRKEMGGLTEHQFNKMMEKKEAALEAAERELENFDE